MQHWVDFDQDEMRRRGNPSHLPLLQWLYPRIARGAAGGCDDGGAGHWHCPSSAHCRLSPLARQLGTLLKSTAPLFFYLFVLSLESIFFIVTLRTFIELYIVVAFRLRNGSRLGTVLSDV